MFLAIATAQKKRKVRRRWRYSNRGEEKKKNERTKGEKRGSVHSGDDGRKKVAHTGAFHGKEKKNPRPPLSAAWEKPGGRERGGDKAQALDVVLRAIRREKRSARTPINAGKKGPSAVLPPLARGRKIKSRGKEKRGSTGRSPENKRPSPRLLTGRNCGPRLLKEKRKKFRRKEGKRGPIL